MKIAIIFFCLFSSVAGAFTCNRSVDPGQVVFFVDTRNSRAEVEAAQRAACERGQSFQRMGTGINVSSFTTEVTRLANANKSVAALIISGHDGGGNIHGDNGQGLDKVEAIAAMKAAYRRKPQLLNNFKSVYLWGCWTNGPNEVAEWRSAFPSLQMISGFIDMGPLNTTAASHSILRGLLTREHQIGQQRDRNSVRRMIAGVQHINQTYAAVYAEACGENLYYYNTQGSGADSNPNLTAGTHFVNYDNAFTCPRLPPDFAQKRDRVRAFYDGRLPIPADTRNGELMQLYAWARNNALCLKNVPILNADRIGLLRFFPAVKTNFARAFQAQINSANSEWAELKRYAFDNRNLNPFSAVQIMSLRKLFDEAGPHIFLPTERNLAGRSRAQIRNMIVHLTKISNHPLYGSRRAALRQLRDKMDRYLYQVDPACMNFVDWHEVVPGYTPYGEC